MVENSTHPKPYTKSQKYMQQLMVPACILTLLSARLVMLGGRTAFLRSRRGIYSAWGGSATRLPDCSLAVLLLLCIEDISADGFLLLLPPEACPVKANTAITEANHNTPPPPLPPPSPPCWPSSVMYTWKSSDC